MENEREIRYLSQIIEPIRVCSLYRPKMGRKTKSGLTLSDFQKLYESDSFYSWFGLGNPRMYAAHKAAGGMTSVYRQIGIGCQNLFSAILQDELGLSSDQASWSYSIKGANNRTRKLSLDARITLEDVSDPVKRIRIKEWMNSACFELNVNERIIESLQGVVFEVRQGYKRKDSKRQNADISNAANAYSQAYLPCVLLLSTQMDEDIYSRYRAERWQILIGKTSGSSNDSTYDFMNNIIGYDLASFFKRNEATLHREIEQVLDSILSPK
ncbi:MAG: hypothetical protein NTY37_09295 [Methanothrix sp.]|nr:hypothetical protein [Methanothrix sp.]